MATRWLLDLLRTQERLRRLARRRSDPKSYLEMSSLIPFYRQTWKEAAERLCAEFVEIDAGLWRVSLDGVTTFINNHKVQIDDPVVLNIAGNKGVCNRLLQEQGLPVPPYLMFTLSDLDRARHFMESQPGRCFVVKPSSGTAGARGVTTHVRTFRECRRAAALASLYGEDLLLECFVPGESYRLLILDGRMIHATRRRGRRLAGDGVSTIQALLRDRARALPEKVAARRDVEMTLAAQGLTLDSTVPSGQEILAAGSAERQDGFTETRTVFNEDVTQLMSNAIQEEARRAAEIIGSRFAGVDVITLNPAASLSESGGAINEVNTTPGLHHHHGLLNESEVSPAVAVLCYLLSARRTDDELVGCPGPVGFGRVASPSISRYRGRS